MNVDTICAIADKKILLSNGTLKAFRESHLHAFRDAGFQAPNPDDYKFTNLEKFFSGLAYEPKNLDAEENLVVSTGLPTLCFADGVLQENFAKLDGVTVSPLKAHFAQVKDALKLGNALSHLHHSLLEEGVVIEVAKNVEVREPLRIVHIASKTVLSAPTVFIVAGPSSKVTILEECIGANVPYAQINETYVVAHPGARVEHIQLTEGSEAGIHHGALYAEVEKDATVTSVILNTSGKLIRKNLCLNLNAPGALGESYSLFLTHGSEHSDVNTVINHRAPDSSSSQIAKGILSGESRGVFTGLIHIFPDAQRVVSSQINKNLLLSKKAQVHSQPQLEIFADDVKCSHGSTTGQLSPDEVFYFQTRGIPAEKARTLLAHGFGMEVVGKIQNALARDRVGQFILKHLETKFALGRLA